MLGHSRPFSYSPGGFSQEDFSLQKRSFLPDDTKVSSLQANMTRPNGKSIYIQRKEYSETLNKESDNFQVRVEHLFTSQLDGVELSTVDDCVAKLKRLDTKGRLWPQEMIMEVQGGYLLLNDIETKGELESHPLSSILETQAVLESCTYNSVLAVTMQERGKRLPQVYMFQCEETEAELIKSDLDNAVQNGGGNMTPYREPYRESYREPYREPYREQSDIRINLENIIGQQALGNFRARAVQRTPTPEDYQSRWRDPENVEPPPFSAPEVSIQLDYSETENIPPLPVRVEGVRNKDIFNRVLNDMEIFVDRVSAVINASSGKKDSAIKRNMFMRRTKKSAATLPPLQEYVSFLQKTKYGFNLLGQLEGTLKSPTAEEFVHIFISTLGIILPHYPTDVPSTVVSPLLTVKALRLLSQVADHKEDLLWRSLGDSWNLSRSEWLGDVQPYIPEFYDGWRPPPPSHHSSPPQSAPQSRSSSQLSPYQPQRQMSRTNSSWGSPSPTPRIEPPQYMRVIYDFLARSNQELSIMKGEVVQVVQKSRQGWIVRNSRDEEGSVPQSVLEEMDSNGPMEDLPQRSRRPLTLDMSSTMTEVQAWLEYKGFSRITVRSLGVLTGRQLLGMTKEQLRTVSPEEGAKVFFQLQPFRSAIALNSEQSGLYNGRNY